MPAEQPKREQFNINGDQIVKKVKELIREGNVRRIIIKNDKGDTVVEIPVTIAVIGTVIAPILAAVGGLAALLTNCTIIVKRK